jgi:DNA mismatch repair ATPase MutS
MTQSELLSYYKKRKSDFATLLDKAKSNINAVSNLRILVAVIFIAVFYFAVSNRSLFYAEIPLLILFLVLVKWHTALFEKKTHLENLVKINELESESVLGNDDKFSSGVEFINPLHPYSHDLDIFGEGSLYQSVNRCNTIHGRREMAQRLSAPLASAEEIQTSQISARELATKTDFRQHFQAAGMEIEEQQHDREQLLAWLKQPSFLYSKPFYKYFLPIFSAVTIGLVIASFFFVTAQLLAIIFALIQWGVLGFHIKKVNAFHEYISKKKIILQKYAHLLFHLQREKFSTAHLKKLSDSAQQADVKVKSLASLVSALNARLNAMTTLIVNSLLFYDLQCVYRLEKWKHENASNLKTWLEAVSETEVLCSVGTFSFNHPNFIYPTIDSTLAIETKELGHPLILPNECVTNDVLVGKNQAVLIITGANMAGKSTFLRTIGVNLVLALSGAPVCAKEFRCPIINMRSGMRTADSLKDHQSYFYAELNRLKTIMDELRNDKPLFILLDEILKGTNSTDKQSGSIALVKQLLRHPCLALIATHDLALGELETEFPSKIKNFCFEANIENDQLSFDYKLKPGLAQKMNATFLMKKMGIIPA